MKTKKILFTTAGVFKCVVGGCVLGFFLLMLLLTGVIKDTLLQNTELFEELLEGAISGDSSMAFLQDMTNSEIADYLMKTVNGFALFMVFLGATSLTLGIFTCIFAKKYEFMLKCKTKRKVIFTILDYIFYIGLIANILTTVAMFIKDKPTEDISIN